MKTALKRWNATFVWPYRRSIVIVLAAGLYYFCLPEKLFRERYSTVLLSQEGELLSAAIAADGQWRFPPSEITPDKFSTALRVYEDKRFNYHFGVDPIAFVRAMWQNASAGKIVSGGSTITMQVIRLSRNNRSRTVVEKLIELVLATRLEWRYSKAEIMALYAAHAPFGGNVVGLEAACWRYFGRATRELSWAEAALLAVLPNSPSMIHPGRNREALKHKRDALLDKLVAEEIIDQFTCDLAKEEPVPDKPLPLPRHARHLLNRMVKEGRASSRTISTVNFALQDRVEQQLAMHHLRLSGNKINNLAAIVARVSTGEVVAYAGNVASGKFEGQDVDIIASARSTGSILKPFLYAVSLDEGKILPSMLLPDIPVFINGFTPKNFSRDYDGAVPADVALIRSLNVPAVHLLREYRYEKFYDLLRNMGMTTLQRPADHYGLSLILGGAEGTLWDIAGMYASMARTLNNFHKLPGKGRYRVNDYHPLVAVAADTLRPEKLSLPDETSHVSAASIYLTFQALTELYRPGEESGWKQFQSSRKIAWKTGTSFGFRDAWAIGVTPEYIVAVWAGNADGEGRPGLTGTDAAAPVMFDIFSQLDGYSWFRAPRQEMESAVVCARSGHRISPFCGKADTVQTVRRGLETRMCPYHRKVYLSPDGRNQVNSECEDLYRAHATNWFVLPPAQEYYYRQKNLSYKSLPAFRPGCPSATSATAMELIYPKPGARLFIPRDLSGTPGTAVFQLAHRNPGATVYWHLDGSFISATKKVHQLQLNPAYGKHALTVMDDTGETIELDFEVLSTL